MSDTRPSVPRDSAALAERLGVSVYDLEVVDVADVSGSLREIRLTAPGLEGLDYQPGQDLMLSVPSAAGAIVRRRYTIRSFDPSGPTVTLAIVLHGHGPGATWASAVTPGDVIEGIGPRGKVVADPSADWHLFVGDESFAPAALHMAESLPAPATAFVVLEVETEADELALVAPAVVDGVRWVHRSGAAANESGRLVAAVAGLDLPAGTGRAYVGGEKHVAHAIGDELERRGIDKDHRSVKPYWSAGLPNADHGEPAR